jgi:wobble nucleotide-excising tRNase
MGTIANLRSLQSMGVFADRNPRSPSLQLRRYNLVYGFNGSGKSTLSRLFASLQTGSPHRNLPEGGRFEVEMDDGSIFGCPNNLTGLEQRLVVFNADYIEENLQWDSGRANPVFYIGSDQADAANELKKLEAEIENVAAAKKLASATEKGAEKTFGNFKRELARSVASRLHLVGRKYEAPSLARDFETWKDHDGAALSDDKLKAAEDTCRLDEPMPRLDVIGFDGSSILEAYRFIIKICGQSLATVALEEAQRFPEMLLWLKQGHDFHEKNRLVDCLFCGNAISTERRAHLAYALDNQIDQFIAKLTKTAARLQEIIAALGQLERTLPTADDFYTDLRTGFKQRKDAAADEVRNAIKLLEALQAVLTIKRESPATPADMSGIADEAAMKKTVDRLADAIRAVNASIELHNMAVGDFRKHKEAAETAIRRHFIVESRDEYATLAQELEAASVELTETQKRLEQHKHDANELRLKIRAHGPAADVINRLVASYLGHSELTIHPVEEGYELHRHGSPISGSPSEGEKTAIAISYFISSIEADNRKISDTIVVIDDPVSSLDTKALNFACSLVRNRLENAGQVFVLTHNLQCMNEFKKGWKKRAREVDGNDPRAAFLFIDVTIPEGQTRRTSTIVEMSKLLRDYDSEYHFLFSHILRFLEKPDTYHDHGYMMPNVLRRVLEVFLAFKCPGTSGLVGQLRKLCADYPDLDRDRLGALDRLAQVESHSDNLDDLLSFSAMTVEETRAAVLALMHMMEQVDAKHVAALRRLCR